MRLRIVSAARRETWAICQSWLTAALTDLVAAGNGKSARLPKVTGGVAVLPLHGMISQRSSVWQEIFGGTSTEAFGAAFSRAINEPGISAVVLDVDSPGGTTPGVEELSELINRGKDVKPVTAVANSQAASAAYWLASQVGPGRFFAAPGSEIGSIGVFRMHEDISQLMANEGVKVEFLAVPQYKTEGNPYQPLTDDARVHHMAQVQQTYEAFVKSVARGRNTTAANVKKGFGEGRTFHGQQAADMGMVDGVKSLSQVLAAFGSNAVPMRQQASDSSLSESICQAWASGICEELRLPVASDIRRARLALAEKA